MIESEEDGEFVKITNNENKIVQEKKLLWLDQPIQVYEPRNGGVWYPRVIRLENGNILCAFDTNEDGARAVIKIVASIDLGYTWEETPVLATNLLHLDCANANFYLLENGHIWLAYRANTMIGDEYYSSIRINISEDNGLTWNEHSIVVEEKGEGGVYEPQFQLLNNKITVFYANDSLNVVKNKKQQNIEYKIWEENKWSETYVASSGRKTYSRDGMPVLAVKKDGSYLMVIESTSLLPNSEFIIQIKESKDGEDWSTPLRNIYIPRGIGKKAGAPYVVTMKDGTLVVSFQTDEDAGENGDRVSKMKVIVSKDVEGKEFAEPSQPFETPDGYTSSWNSLLVEGEFIYAFTSTNYPKASIQMNIGRME